eukprot:1154073_1
MAGYYKTQRQFEIICKRKKNFTLKKGNLLHFTPSSRNNQLKSVATHLYIAMVRGQQMDMSAIDKSLDEIIAEKKQSDRGSRGRGGARGRGRGRGRRSPNRNRTQGRGRNNRNRGNRGRSSYGRNRGRSFSNSFDRRSFNKRRGVRGRGRFNAPYHRKGFATKPLHRPSGTNNTYTTQGKVVVSNLKKHVSSDDIKEIFEKFGTVTQAFVNFDGQNGVSTGTAEVYYSRGTEARQAQKELDGAKIDNGVIRVRLDIPSNFGAKSGGPRGSRRGGFGMRYGNRSYRGRGGGRNRGRGRNNPLQR